ncbi:putative lactoylglutathione lyase [Paenibacillus castaneae]|uniref:VOC family protein n=1 Tax=Paenibacillus castaneae TaxID=474957 RepID=UPI000C9BB30D|nr:VOC family protein [Paenibacillus castaneae]NIK75399.1 putative lactoylglutathione lyase [Paenibacillus castaneae]
MGNVKLTGPTMVLLVSHLEASVEFYKKLGFEYELIGGPDVQHVHMTRDSVTFILHQAKHSADVRPFSSVEGGLYFDAFCYTDVRELLEEITAIGVEIVNGPHLNDFFSEFTIQDVDGYRIAFGG